jgi:hypothetical protein
VYEVLAAVRRAAFEAHGFAHRVHLLAPASKQALLRTLPRQRDALRRKFTGEVTTAVGDIAVEQLLVVRDACWRIGANVSDRAAGTG